MIVLDTNVISELTKPSAIRSPSVEAWARAQPIADLWITSITYGELLAGIFAMPEGRRKKATFEATESAVTIDLDGRILAYGAGDAVAYGRISAERRAKGLSAHGADVQIAAIASTRGFAVATRNVADFGAGGLTVINPWDHPAP